MQIVITMAGLGSRFRDAGFNIPKYMIEVCGKSLFEWSLLSLNLFKKEDFYFIVRRADDAKDFIASLCYSQEIDHFSIIEIDHLTSGQAETVMEARSIWNPEDSLLIYNIDTFIEPNSINPCDIMGDGFIPCFYGQGNHWSFVRLNDELKAIEVREKIRISDNCTIGAYYFRTAQLYSDLYQEYYSGNKNQEVGEKYVAPLYNQLIANGGDVFISVIPSEKVHVLGTPEEVAVFEHSILS